MRTKKTSGFSLAEFLLSELDLIPSFLMSGITIGSQVVYFQQVLFLCPTPCFSTL